MIADARGTVNNPLRFSRMESLNSPPLQLGWGGVGGWGKQKTGAESLPPPLCYCQLAYYYQFFVPL